MFRSRLEKRLSAALYAAHIADGITHRQGLLIVDEVAIDDLHRPRNVTDRVLGSLEVDDAQRSTYVGVKRIRSVQ